MSERLVVRILLGLPLDRTDIDALIQIAPELRESDLRPGILLPLPLWAILDDRGVLEEIRAGWRLVQSVVLPQADPAPEGMRAAAPPAEPQRLCSKPDCPLRSPPGPAEASPTPEQASHQRPAGDEYPLHLVQVPAAGTTPKSIFDSMTSLLRGRLKNGVKRVIVTDPYVHSDRAEDGTPGGHDALLTFLCNLGLETSNKFALELTPAPKLASDGQPLEKTPLGRKLRQRFPQMTLKHHNVCAGGFHDRFYLTVDGSGNWDGLYGPSMNGLASLALVLVGDLRDDCPARRRLQTLLDTKPAHGKKKK